MSKQIIAESIAEQPPYIFVILFTTSISSVLANISRFSQSSMCHTNDFYRLIAFLLANEAKTNTEAQQEKKDSRGFSLTQKL